MRLLSKILRPEIIFILSILGFCGITSALFITFFREQISQYHPLSWSPDGSRLAFVAEEDNTEFEIFVIDTDGSNPVKLTSQSYHRINLELRWSADSEILYYAITRTEGNPRRRTTTWYRTNIRPRRISFSLFGQQGIDPYRNPVATQDEIDRSVETHSESDTLYAISVCNNPYYHTPEKRHVMDECEKTLEVYSSASDNLVWSFGRGDYDSMRSGILPVVLFLLAIVCLFSIMVSFMHIIAKIFKFVVIRVFGKPDSRKQKEKRKAFSLDESNN